MRFAVSFVVAALVATACLALAQGSSGSGNFCSGQTSCSLCTDLMGCGWDSSLATCEPGSFTGPTTGSSAHWHYGTTSCPCSVNTNCNQCITGTMCGWDGSTCRNGNSNGPTDGAGSTGTWDYGLCINLSPAAVGLAGTLLLIIIIVPIVVVLCLIGCCVYCCCFRQTQVILEQPVYAAAVY